MKRDSLIQSSVLLIISKIAWFAYSFGVLVLFTRHGNYEVYAIENIGKFLLGIVWCNFFILCSDFGLSDLSIRDGASDQSQLPGLYAEACRSKLAWSVISGCFAVFLAIILYRGDWILISCTLLGIATGFLRGMGQLMESFLVVLNRSDYVAFFSMGQFGLLILVCAGAIYLQMNVIFILFLHVPVMLVFVIWRKKFLASQFALHWQIHFNGWTGGLLRRSAPFFMQAVTTAFAGAFMPVFYLSVIDSSQQQVTFLQGAQKITMALTIISQMIARAAYPRLTETFGRNDAAFRTSFRNLLYLLFLVAMPAAVGLLLYARSAVMIIYGPRVLKTFIPLSILAVSLPLFFLEQGLGHFLNACHRQKLRMKITGGFTIIFAGAGWPVMVCWGAVGAAIMTGLFCLCVVVAYTVIAFRILGGRNLINALFAISIRICPAVCAMFLAYELVMYTELRYMHSLVQMAFVGTAYCLALVLSVQGHIRRLSTAPGLSFMSAPQRVKKSES
ncbi:MAG: hypothetical protein GY795_13410 [Desulfobacterales bacterium]|nr:hypothetical protein [Desulfobacterales bacterium]